MADGRSHVAAPALGAEGIDMGSPRIAFGPSFTACLFDSHTTPRGIACSQTQFQEVFAMNVPITS